MPDQYEVKSGDVLGHIARKYDTTVSRLMRMNKGTIDHPDRIFPGQCLNVPSVDESSSFSSAPASSVVSAGECQEDYVEIIHVTGVDKLFFLTQSELTEIEREEELVCAPVKSLYQEIQADEDGGACKTEQPDEMAGQAISSTQQKKQAVVAELESLGVVSANIQSTPPLTEIKRLRGNKHYTYVRSDKIESHWRSYSMTAKDRKRDVGWMNEAGIDAEKLRRAVESDFGIKFKGDLWKLDPKGNLSQSLNQFYQEMSWSVWGDKDSQDSNRSETGFDASAEAQFMRFAAGAEASGEFTPTDGKVHLQAKADAQFNLAQGKVAVEQSFPANDYSEIRIYYRVGGWDGKRTYETLGHFQARLSIAASGYAGASAMLAANINVDCTQGVPTIKGVAAGKADQGINAEAGAFAGVRAGCELLGALYWTDVLSQQSDWKVLCQIGPKVDGAAGVGAEAYLKLGFSEITGKFLLKAHAGLVVGLGASGSFLLEISANEIIEMLHFVYNSLLKVDFRYLELFEGNTSAFDWYVKTSLFALSRGLTAYEAARELANSLDVKQIWDEVGRFFVGRSREAEGTELAHKVLADIEQGTGSVFRHSPPEVKGPVIDNILYDWWATPELWSGKEEKVDALKKILESFQSWRDFRETMERMNPQGTAEPANYGENVERLFDFIDADLAHRRLYLQSLEVATAIPDRPVQLDPHGLCRSCGIA